MFIEFIPLCSAYNSYTRQGACKPDLACTYLTCTRPSATHLVRTQGDEGNYTCNVAVDGMIKSRLTKKQNLRGTYIRTYVCKSEPCKYQSQCLLFI